MKLTIALNKITCVALLLVMCLGLNAQRWKKYRQELNFGVGPTWFLADVGGFQDEPTNSVADMNFKTTSFGVYAGYSFNFSKAWAIQGQFTYGWLEAKDIHAGNAARQNRNFDIRTQMYEFAVLGRWYFIKEKFGHAFRFKGTRSGFLYGLSAYATIGVGGMYFNPQGKHPFSGAGKNYQNLAPLGTEGQTVPGSGLSPYSQFTIVIPVGVGLKWSLGSRWGIGGEMMIRNTFSDFIDDVSGVYYDNAAIVAANGGNPEAGWLADPSIRQDSWTGPGERRGGSKYNDFYMTFMISASYKLLKGKTFKPRF